MAKRGRKPSSERKGYFYELEEQAVIDYKNETDEVKKNKIFNEILYPAFSKMVESIIRRWQLYLPDETFEETFYDTLSFLIIKFNKFQPEKGKKAYSYFGTVCKHYLWHKSEKYKKRIKNFNPSSNITDTIHDDIRYSENQKPEESNYSKIIESTISEVNNLLSDENSKLSDNERKIGEQIKDLMENWEQIFSGDESNKLNKSKVQYFFRENTFMKQKDVRESLKLYKNMYYNIKKSMKE